MTKPMLSNPIANTQGNNNGSLYSNGADRNASNVINLVESSVSKHSDKTGTQRSLQLRPKLLKPLTPYENFLQKYVKYIQEGNVERAILLIKQGYMLFPHSTTKKHFKYNSGLFSMMQSKYSKAVNKYFELYYYVAKDLKPKARSTQVDPR